jgi:octaprenyl-diphosphate synthase
MCYFCSVKNLSDIISPIADELKQFEAFFAQTLKSDTEPMDSIMRYVVDTHGKRLRPILVLLGAKLFGNVNEQTLRAAIFAEMVHNATLLHDDVVDDADQRRNKASVKAQFGNLSAVLAGDYLLAKAMLLLMEPDDRAILQEMLRTTAAMSEGELMQDKAFEGTDTLAPPSMSYRPTLGGSVSMDGGARYDMPSKAVQYLKIITRKTALLMQSCCAAGALSVNATAEQVQQISDFGLNFGILFQLRDDILDCEHMEQAKALLPVYYEKTLQTLDGFADSEIVETLKELTRFCAEREA